MIIECELCRHTVSCILMTCCNKYVCWECKYKWDIACNPYLKCMLCLTSINKISLDNLSNMELKQIIIESDNIKQCPQCNVGIEKIDGCNHITCKCGKDFCFICGSSYRHKRIHCDLFCYNRKWIMSRFLGIKYQKSLQPFIFY